MKNLYWVKRSWTYRNTFNKLHDSLFIATEILELAPEEAYDVSIENDDYEEKFCHFAPDWLEQMWQVCPNMTVNFLGTEVVPFSEREMMLHLGQPKLFN